MVQDIGLQIDDSIGGLEGLRMIPRHAQETALRLARGFPVLVITGPRQPGKTKLARALFPDRAYVTLEDLEHREFAHNDPRRFLSRFRAGPVIDEVQRDGVKALPWRSAGDLLPR